MVAGSSVAASTKSNDGSPPFSRTCAYRRDHSRDKHGKGCRDHRKGEPVDGRTSSRSRESMKTGAGVPSTAGSKASSARTGKPVSVKDSRA